MMIGYISFIIIAAAVGAQQYDATNQLSDFKEKTKNDPIEILTTSAGSPVEYMEATSTLNSNLLSNEHFIDEMTSFNRERVPERIVHATGTGAFGYFETTHDISHICKAKLFSKIGKKTPIAARLSLTSPSLGGPDTIRDTSRAIAFKMYTEEGIFDLTGLNGPAAFAIKDPLLFAPLIHSAKRNPATNFPDPNMVWDFNSYNPSTLLAYLYFFSDFGPPLTYRHMAVFPFHTFQVYNKQGVSSFVRFHILPVLGEKHLNATESAKVSAGDPDYYAKDLYNAIGRGDFARWYLKVQILTEKDIKDVDFDVFDVTKPISTKLFPLHDVGIFTLNQNPTNHFAEVEQLAFCPGNLVPGILGSPDKLFEARRLSYRDAQNYRLGSNFKKIPVNCPMRAHTYSRDGVPPVNDNGRDAPNYFRNSFDRTAPYVDKKRPTFIKIVEKEADNLKDSTDFYVNKLNDEQRKNLVQNMLQGLCMCDEGVKKRMVKWFKVIHPDLGSRITKGLANCTN